MHPNFLKHRVIVYKFDFNAHTEQLFIVSIHNLIHVIFCKMILINENNHSNKKEK